MMITPYAPQRLALSKTIATRFIDTGGPHPPLILIHGLGASIEVWDACIADLASEFRVLAFDLPGFGEASKPITGDYDAPELGFFVEQLHHFIQAMQLDQVHLVGSSMGASLIIRYGADHPDVIDKVVLVAPGGFGRFIHPLLRIPTVPGIGKIISQPSHAANAMIMRLAFYDPSLATPDLIAWADHLLQMPGAHHALIKTLQGFTNVCGLQDLETFTTQCQSFKHDTLILWGKQDRIFPSKMAENAIRLLPNARRVIMDQCGHAPQLEQSTRFTMLVKDHLSAS